MRLNGPPQMVRANSVAIFQRRVGAVAQRLGLTYDTGVFVARVEHGRWLADCPCGSGVAVHPEWPEAGCLECGRWWPVVVPIEWRDIEAVLVVRTKALTRGWVPGETVAALEAENTHQGVPTRATRVRGVV